MTAIFLLIIPLWFADNADFVKVSNQQLNDGYSWRKIDCREVDLQLPNIHITTATDKMLVCWKLKK
jgi:hypothetical protein